MAEETEIQNIPLDSHIIADTAYLRQYLGECPEIVLDELDEKNPDDEALIEALDDADSQLFGKIVDRIAEKAVENDRLHDKLADAVHESWLWEQLSNICDDVTVAFLHDAAKETLAEIRNRPNKTDETDHKSKVWEMWPGV